MNIKCFIFTALFNVLAFQGICMAHEYPGLLCAIEGIDGAGKTTLLQNLEQKFASTKIRTIFTKEPGATQLGKYLRKLLNERTITIGTQAEFLLFAADRAEHFEKDIVPHLQQGCLIISDRMADSSVAYQGYLKGLDISMINAVNAWCMQNIIPDITIYLRITPDKAKERIYSLADLPQLLSKNISIAYKFCLMDLKKSLNTNRMLSSLMQHKILKQLLNNSLKFYNKNIQINNMQPPSITQHQAHLWIGNQDTLQSNIIAQLQQTFCPNHGCATCSICNRIREQQHPWIYWLKPDG